MIVIYITTTYDIVDKLPAGTILAGLSANLATLELPDYVDRGERNLIEIDGAAETVDDNRLKLDTLTASLAAVMAEVNGKYEGLDLQASDSVATAATKMLAAGVTWPDVDTYGARLRLIAEAIAEIK